MHIIHCMQSAEVLCSFSRAELTVQGQCAENCAATVVHKYCAAGMLQKWRYMASVQQCHKSDADLTCNTGFVASTIALNQYAVLQSLQRTPCVSSCSMLM